MTFAAAVDRYWEEVGQFSEKAKAAAAKRKECDEEVAFNRLLDADWVGEDRLLTEITDNLVASLVAKRRKMYRHGNPDLGLVSNAQVNRTVTDLLQRVMTRAKKVWKIPLPDMPDWSEHVLPETIRKREMTYAEEAKLNDHMREDYRNAVEFALLTGLRRENVVGLTWDAIDLDGGIIRVVTKMGKTKEILITDEVAAILEEENGRHPMKVFTFVAVRTYTNPTNGQPYVKGHRYPITYSGYGTFFIRLREKAGVQDLTIHDLRKTLGSRVTRKFGLKMAKEILGHSNITITEAHYSHIAQEEQRQALSGVAKDRRKSA